MKESKRKTFNAWMFVVVYAIVGLLGGVSLDTLATYLSASKETASLAASMSIFMGVGFFGAAIVLLFVPKVGYKIIISGACIISIAGLYLVTVTSSNTLLFILSSLLFVGVCLFDAVLPPILSCYTNDKNKNLIFSTALWTNVLGMAAATFGGGELIIGRFASRLGLAKDQAKALSANVDALNSAQSVAYIQAHKDVLLGFIVVAIAALIPVLLMKQKPEDYRDIEKKEHKPLGEKAKEILRVFSSKYVVLWIVYNFMIRFGASLITPYFSVFLSKMGIARNIVSWLVSAQYLAMVIFLLISPILIKKMGRVVCIGGMAFLSIPFMLIIANGAAFGSGMVVAVGSALFLRSGFMNAANTATQSLPMEFVSKELRPAYSSVIFISSGLAQIVSGLIAKPLLFMKYENGYSIAYYITGAIYIVAAVMLLVVFTKKYNRPSSVNQNKDAETAA